MNETCKVFYAEKELPMELHSTLTQELEYLINVHLSEGVGPFTC